MNRRTIRLALALALLLPLPAAAATRLYFPLDDAATITPTQDAGWDDVGQLSRRRLAHSKGSDAITAGSTIDITEDTGGFALDRQYISTQMNSGIVFTSGTTQVSAVLMMREFAATDDVTTCILGVRVLSEDGATVRATLMAVANYSSTGEFINNATMRNKICSPSGTTIGASYTTVSGDRLVVEVGYETDGAETSPQAAAKYGQNATDCTLADTGTTDCAGWIEFSNTITFVAPANRRIVVVN
jgi:hypothetical protein